jgi:hypothetical protein
MWRQITNRTKERRNAVAEDIRLASFDCTTPSSLFVLTADDKSFGGSAGNELPSSALFPSL